MTSKDFLKTAKKETWAIIGLYAAFFVWWYVTAYGFGDDPSEYRYVFGFPEWFFYSCIVGYVGIAVLLWLVIRLVFQDGSFEKEKENDNV